MNERMIELMNEANKDAGFTFTMDQAKSVHELMEKFAELIVRECAGVIENKMPNFTCKEDYENLIRKAGRMDAIDEIKEHFGVE